MLKGVNKQVLEITETQNGYFEKAIFFVKPEYSGMSEGKLRESARKELSDAGAPPEMKSGRREGLKKIITIGGALVSGIVLGLIFSSVL